jgi:GAF domain-containing protein
MATILHEADLIQRVPLTSHLSRRAHDLAREAVGISDKSELFSHLTRECGEAVKADRAFLALVHEESGELVIHTVTGEGWTEERRAQRLRLTSSQGIPEPNDVASADKKRDRRGITGYVALTGKTYLTGNVSSDPYHFFFFEDAKSEIAVPLIDNDGITRGVLNMQSVHENYFNEVFGDYCKPDRHALAGRTLSLARSGAR